MYALVARISLRHSHEYGLREQQPALTAAPDVAGAASQYAPHATIARLFMAASCTDNLPLWLSGSLRC